MLALTRAASLLAFLAWLVTANAAPIVFTNETDYVNALASGGYVWVLESSEDERAWGHVRSTIVGGNFTAPTVTNGGVRWTANNDTSQVTTSSGAARTGDWGIYALPHGSYSAGTGCTVPGACGDGIIATATQSFLGVAGWVRGFSGSKVALFLNGDLATPIEFPEVCDANGENCVDYGLLGGGYKFFGVIDSAGFASFEFHEMEGTAEDQKYLWFDDFTLAFAHPPPPQMDAVSVVGNQVTLTINGLAVNAHYTLECSPDLSTNTWTTVTAFTASAGKTNLSEAISPNPRPRFYRLRCP